MTETDWIAQPDSDGMDLLCGALAARSDGLDKQSSWPAEQLQLCANHGVYRWFLAPEHGGLGWDEADLMRGYLRLGAACLTTAFVITQATGAMRRIAASAGDDVRQQLLPDLLGGAAFTTLGISHLTTSRRHLGRAVLRADETGDGFVLDGFSPWVTGGAQADSIVLGAQLPDGRQLLAVLPTDLQGVSADEPARLAALNGSCTGAVRLDRVRMERRWLLSGPEHDVMRGATGAKTGGLQTSALAIGLADSAIAFLEKECEQRAELTEPAAHLREEQTELTDRLLASAAGTEVCSGEQLRSSANSLALRSAQASLAAAKGTGYVVGHPAGRWCREALFFLVWSCPQPVMAANLCELAGIAD